MKNKLLKIINHYGIEHQQRKLEEEIFELQQAITLFETSTTKYNIEEELADVMVLLHQIKFYYDLDDVEVARIFTNKIDRQIERMKDGSSNNKQS